MLAGGDEVRHGDAPPAFTLTFRNRAAQARVVRDGHVGLLEAYFDGDLELEGDPALAFRAALDAKIERQPSLWVRLRNAALERRQSNRTVAQARANARFHYGLGEAFYREWLDVPSMMSASRGSPYLGSAPSPVSSTRPSAFRSMFGPVAVVEML